MSTSSTRVSCHHFKAERRHQHALNHFTHRLPSAHTLLAWPARASFEYSVQRVVCTHYISIYTLVDLALQWSYGQLSKHRRRTWPVGTHDRRHRDKTRFVGCCFSGRGMPPNDVGRAPLWRAKVSHQHAGRRSVCGDCECEESKQEREYSSINNIIIKLLLLVAAAVCIAFDCCCSVSYLLRIYRCPPLRVAATYVEPREGKIVSCFNFKSASQEVYRECFVIHTYMHLRCMLLFLKPDTLYLAIWWYMLCPPATSDRVSQAPQRVSSSVCMICTKNADQIVVISGGEDRNFFRRSVLHQLTDVSIDYPSAFFKNSSNL